MEKTQNTDTKESNTHDKISTEETDRKTLLRHCGNTEKRSKNLPHLQDIQESAVITTTQ